MTKTFITLLLAALLLVTLAYAENLGESVHIMTGPNSLFYSLDESNSESLSVEIDSEKEFDFTLSNTTSFAENTLYAFVVETEYKGSDMNVVTVTVSYNYDELTQTTSVPNSIKFVSKVGGVLPNQVQDLDAMVLNVTLTVPLNSAALELAIVHEPMPEQNGGFGTKISYVGGTGNKDNNFELAGTEKMVISVNSDESFDMEATYYGSENPTTVSPGNYNAYYFFELSVGATKARSIAATAGGAFRYVYEASKDSVAENLNFLIFDGAQWISFNAGETKMVDTNTRTLTQNFQQALGGFPGYNSKKHYAIVASIDVVTSGSTVEPSGQASGVTSSGNAQQSGQASGAQSVEKSGEVVESSTVAATVSSASTKGFTLITALVVIVAVLGL